MAGRCGGRWEAGWVRCHARARRGAIGRVSQRASRGCEVGGGLACLRGESRGRSVSATSINRARALRKQKHVQQAETRRPPCRARVNRYHSHIQRSTTRLSSHTYIHTHAHGPKYTRKTPAATAPIPACIVRPRTPNHQCYMFILQSAFHLISPA